MMNHHKIFLTRNHTLLDTCLGRPLLHLFLTILHTHVFGSNLYIFVISRISTEKSSHITLWMMLMMIVTGVTNMFHVRSSTLTDSLRSTCLCYVFLSGKEKERVTVLI